MANIRTYEAPQGLGLNPTETGIDATLQAARRIGTFYNQTSDLYGQEGAELRGAISDAGELAVKRVDSQEISAGALQGTKLTNNLHSAWLTVVNGGKDAAGNPIPAADPNDPSVRQKFMDETVEPALEQFRSSFSTENSQRFAEQFVDHLRNDLSVTTAADQSTRAGVAAMQNAKGTINNLATAVRNGTSPESALQQLDIAASATSTSSPTLDAGSSAKVKAELIEVGGKQIVTSYLYGVADKNPGAIAGIIASGKYGRYLDPSETNQILNYAKVTERLNQSQAAHARELQEHTDKQAFDRAAINIQLSTLPKDTSEKPTLPPTYYDDLRKAAMMPGADLGRVRSMVEDGVRIANRLNKPEPMATVSARNSMDILTRMRATDATHVDGEAAANQAYGDGQISASDRNMLVKEWRESKTTDGETLAKTKSAFFDAVEPMIVKPLSDIGDDGAKLRLYRFQMDVNRKVDEYRSTAGKNPRDLFDPTKPDYLGNPSFINQPQYQSSMQGNLPAQAQPNVNLTGPGKGITGVQVTAAPIPKRERGETLDAWMKRTGRGIAMPPAATPGPAAPMSR